MLVPSTTPPITITSNCDPNSEEPFLAQPTIPTTVGPLAV